MYIDFHPKISHINPLDNQADFFYEIAEHKVLEAGTRIPHDEPKVNKKLGKVEDAFILGVFLLALGLIAWIIIHANYGL